MSSIRARFGSPGRLQRDEEFHRFIAGALPGLLRGAYLLLGDVDLAEDAVQGTLLRVFRRWSDAREAPEAHSRRTLIDVCRDHWRRQGRRPQAVCGADPELGADHEAIQAAGTFSDEVDRRYALDQALSALPSRQREVLVLRFLFDLSIAQTAELLQMPDGTVKSNVHRGLLQLRNALDPPEVAQAC